MNAYSEVLYVIIKSNLLLFPAMMRSTFNASGTSNTRLKPPRY